MKDGLGAALSVAASGLHAQSQRMRVVSENLANARSTASMPGGQPYARKTVSFAQALDNAEGVARVKISGFGKDDSPFRVVHNPGHPAADEDGFVLLPNVNMMTEMADMREAGRSYEANLQVIRQTKEMVMATIELLRSGR